MIILDFKVKSNYLGNFWVDNGIEELDLVSPRYLLNTIEMQPTYETLTLPKNRKKIKRKTVFAF